MNSRYEHNGECTFSVSTSSLSTEESMKTSLKWGQPCWPFRTFSCSLLSTEFGSALPSGPAVSSSTENFESLFGLFSAHGGLISGLTRILCPFTTPHVSTAVIFSSLSLTPTRSTFKPEEHQWTHLNMNISLNVLGSVQGKSTDMFIFFLLSTDPTKRRKPTGNWSHVHTDEHGHCSLFWPDLNHPAPVNTHWSTKGGLISTWK